MKTLIASLAFGSICFFSFAQKAPVKFGEIPMEDLMMKSYEHDSSAAAVFLVDYGEAYIRKAAAAVDITFERHVRIKILKTEGKEWANAIIPLFQIGPVEEKISHFKASTFNLVDGKIVETEVSKEGIFREKFNRNFIHHKFTFPEVKEGSVLEYSYNIHSDFLLNFPNWEFQRKIPTRFSEYWAIIPDFLTFQKYMQGYIPVTRHEVKSMNVNGFSAMGHHYVSEQVPAFIKEPHMASEKEYLSKINFALSHVNFPGQPVYEIMGSWAKLNALLLEDDDFYDVVKGSGFLKSIVTAVVKDVKDPVQKITAIHNYVKNTIEWDGQNDFYAGNLKKVLEQKKGSSGDINLLLAAMLQKADLDVDMVLVSTRDHGFVREQFPMTRQFNYVVCQVRLPDKTIFLDGTEKQLPIDVLPERCLNGRGLVVSKTHHGWTTLSTKTKSKTVVNAVISLDPSGSLKSKLELTHDGYDANRMRKAYVTKGEDMYIKELVGSKPWRIESSKFENVTELSHPVKEVHELEVSDYASVAGDNIYLNPYLTAQIEMNPYKAESRVYPVDYESPVEQTYLCRINLPEGYVVEELPESKALVLPGNAARFIYNVSLGAQGNWISVTSSFQINKNVFVQDDYPYLREFYNQVVAKQAEQIVLKKKL